MLFTKHSPDTFTCFLISNKLKAAVTFKIAELTAKLLFLYTGMTQFGLTDEVIPPAVQHTPNTRVTDMSVNSSLTSSLRHDI